MVAFALYLKQSPVYVLVHHQPVLTGLYALMRMHIHKCSAL
jgi:glucokinase